MKFFYALAFLLSSAQLLNAQTTTTWIGPSTGSWSDPSNWDNGVPATTSGGSSYIIVFDGSAPSLTGSVINIADVTQTNALSVYRTMRVINNATVNLSGSSASYLNLTDTLKIETGSTVNVGGTTLTRFSIGISDFSSVAEIDGTLDLQGQGLSTAPTIFVASPSGFFGNNAKTTVKGKVILSGLNAKIDILGSPSPVFENGGILNVRRNGGTVPKGNYKDGSLIKIEGVTNSTTSIIESSNFDGVIEWNCPNQTVSGASALVLPSNSFSYIDSLVITNTGVGRTVRCKTNPNNFYVKTLVINDGTIEFGSPTGSGIYTGRFDNIIQNGGTMIGNASAPSDGSAFEPDTIKVSGNFIQNAGTFDFSNRTPTNSTANASCVMQVGGNVKIGGTVKLSQATTAQNCALIFNGSGTQDFEMTGTFTNKIRTIINNSSPATGVNAISNITLPDSLVFNLGYFWLNNFDLTNPLPVQPVSNPFLTHVVTNGTGFFIQKNVKNIPVGIPIGASTTTVNPLIIAFTTSDSLDVAAKVDLGITPAIAFTDKAVDRTWQIKPLGIAPSPLGVSFGYSNLTPLPGDGNINFSYSANDEVGLYAGGNWQVISLPGGIAPTGTNPYAISYVISNSLLIPNVASPLVISNVNGVVPVANLINLTVSKAGSSALLKWDVAELTERISRFEILRSTDARNFINIGNVTAQSSRLNYSFADNELQPGINYYRIKMFDATGRFKYSVVVAVVNKTCGIVITSLIPTVVNSNATMMISSAVKAPLYINVTDMLGRVVIKTNAVLNEGSNQLNIDCSRLQAGTYQIAGYNIGTKTNIVRFVKE